MENTIKITVSESLNNKATVVASKPKDTASIIKATSTKAEHYANIASGYAANASKSAEDALASENLAKDWANKMGGTVDSVEYSSKYYASQASETVTSAISDIQAQETASLDALNDKKIEAIESITNAENSAENTITTTTATSISNIQQEGAQQVANIKQTGFYVEDGKLYYIDEDGNPKEIKTGGAGLEVCDIGIALYIDETKGLRRRLNGQILDINTNTQAFLTRLQSIIALYPSLSCTESDWQAAKTLSDKGQVGKFVLNYAEDGTTVVSVRLPRVVNIQGLMDLSKLGLTVEASLPNITGSFSTKLGAQGKSEFTASGAMSAFDNTTAEYPAPTGSTKGTNRGVLFNAHNSNSTYQDGATVQEEAVQYPFFIQIATGQETENNIVNDIELNNPFVFGKSEYSKIPKDNLSWLASHGQYNPKGPYSSYYNWILKNVNKGTENFKCTTGYAFKNTGTENSDYYWWISTDNPVVGMTVYEYSRNTMYPIGKIQSVSNGQFTYTNNGSNITYTCARYAEQDATGEKWITDYDFEINTEDETFKLPLLDGSESIIGGDLNTRISFSKLPTDGIYIAPCNGYFSAILQGSNGQWVYINNETQGVEANDTINNQGYARSSLLVKRGDKVRVAYTANGNYSRIDIAKAIGNGTLYYYVGETVQNDNLIDAGRMGEQIAELGGEVNVAIEQMYNLLPAGVIVSSGAPNAPNGFLRCNHAAVSRTTYARLFNAIGTTYGAGDGSTTFNLPDASACKFITSEYVGVRGNGKALGLTAPLSNGAMVNVGLNNSAVSGWSMLNYRQDMYNANVGTVTDRVNNGTQYRAIGVVQDQNTSGLMGNASTTLWAWYIKY